MFNNRIDAGQKLAEALIDRGIKKEIVMAVPRGGVVVGAQIAQRLHIPMDIIIPKKIGAPSNPEVAIGAVTEDGTTIFNHYLLEYLNLTEQDLAPVVKNIIAEIKRRMQIYKGKAKSIILRSKDVILVDDGIATGSTIIAALKSIKSAKCKSITLAIPVVAPDVIEKLTAEVDNLVCLCSQEPFYAVGQFYKNFNQISDDEVISLLAGTRNSY
ncbi:phosphoribosyltransferase [Desulfotomaculum defluvii]